MVAGSGAASAMNGRSGGCGPAAKAIICAGLYGSGSTWTFNLMRGLLEAGGRDFVSEYFEHKIPMAWLESHARAPTLLMKTHKPCDILVGCALQGAPVVLTVRDPRDAVASLMTRFSYTCEEAIGVVLDSAEHLLRLAAVCEPLILKYEDGYLSDPATVERIAGFLALAASEPTRRQLFARLSADSVRRFIGDRFKDRERSSLEAKDEFDAVTHWHPRHVGDGKVGKYAYVVQEAAQLARITGGAARFMRAFHY
jgi:hypothetical protein